MAGQAKRYRAFISYSQKDKTHARRLHSALEAYRVPRGIEAEGVDPKTRRLGRFFRDDEEMGAATDLGAALQGAIADAESLVVVCSPHAAQSRWVNEEIIHFKRTGRADRIFAVIVSGAPNSASGSECFPPGLRFSLGPDGALTDLPAEPLGLDVRKESFQRLVVRLASGLIRTPFDALWKREQRRRSARLAMVSFAAVIGMAIIGVAVTQGIWLPKYQNYVRYGRYAESTASLASARPGTVFQDCRDGSGDCPKMVVIPEGSFLMGSAENDPENEDGWESPERQMTIARFAVSMNEITFADWRTCARNGGCDGYEPNPELEGDVSDHPVVNVSWNDAKKYVAWLSRATGRNYRLLTEAEWEYAARAQTRPDAPHTRFSWGNEDPVCITDAPNGAVSNDCARLRTAEARALISPTADPRMRALLEGDAEFQGAISRTRPVGSFQANAFGLHDMHGNVLELVEDCELHYDAAKRDGSAVEADDAPPPGMGNYHCSRVIRGGSEDIPAHLRSASRGSVLDPGGRVGHIGFRVARTP